MTTRHSSVIALLFVLTISFSGCRMTREAGVAPASIDQTDREITTESRAVTLVNSITIFVLAIFVGFEVISKVPPTLHTPLMSGSNAISGITLVGALVAAGNTESPWSAALGLAAVILATINVVGGFMVTGRMLAMFQRKP